MFVRNPYASLSRWGRTSLLLALTGLPLYASCTTSEDTEPYVPARQGASQPEGKGDLLSEDDACAVLRQAAKDAYARLHCEAELAECPGFLRPGGGNGCYEYYSDSVDACQASYADASSCRTLAPCLATAVRNDDLPTCEMVDTGGGGAAGAGPVTAGGAAGTGGAAPVTDAGAAGSAGATPGAAGVAGAAGATP